MTTKACTLCKRVLPVTEFSPHGKKRDGLQSQCKDCRRKDMATRRAEGRTKDREQRQAYDAALVALRDRHRAEFDVLYDAERVARGLKPKTLRAAS